MNLRHTFESARKTALLKFGQDTYRTEEAAQGAVFILFLVSLVTAFGPALFPRHEGAFILYRPDVWDVIMSTVILFIRMVVQLLLAGAILDYFFHSPLKVKGFFSVMGLGSIVMLFGIVPQLAIVGGIWMLIILWNVLTDLAKLKAPEALGFVFVCAVLFWLLSFL